MQYFLSVVFACCLILLGSSCDSPIGGADNPDELYVRFSNNAASAFAIFSIELKAMGETLNPVPAKTWGKNLLADDDSIAPGKDRFFTLAIPNLHHSIYRLGVIDELGNRILLHEQSGQLDQIFDGTITHWGSDKRSVEATVLREASSGLIALTGYSDFAGID